MEATIQQREAPEAVSSSDQDHSISFVQEIPTYLKEAIASFIEEHPNWDQYRLIQAAIAGYLLQKGVDTREINRIYSQSMFCKKAFGQSQ
tara:strand:+ start:248 stop:517 length:270 start_codon:yes stop_codon:yes gene_type:complete